MNASNRSIIMHNSIFAWIVFAACLTLLVPLVAMQFTSAVNWGVMDFIVMGVLLTGAGSMFVLTARRVPRRYWRAIGAIAALLFLIVWSELAVGVFTNIGS